ncbi:MAG: hypothetical protein ACQET1_11205 [Gemmatimonadota bacterium]
MLSGFRQALRFSKGWKNEAPGVRESEIEIPCPGGAVPGTLLLPPTPAASLPGWVTMHGITRPGRSHPTLLRFVRALAYSGNAVLVPEVREWMELDLAPERAARVLKASILGLAGREEVAEHRLGAIGFSFGAPQVLLAGSDPDLSAFLRAVVGYGSYAELEPTLRFMFLGEHELNGTRYTVDPDPYGRWVVAGNYLSEISGREDAGDVAHALLQLARAAGDEQVGAWKDIYEPLKEELIRDVDPSRKHLFRVLASSGAMKESEPLAEELIREMARSATRISPILDFRSRLGSMRVPVRLIHGRQDRLVPFSQTVRLAENLPPGADARVFLTGMFGHSQPDAARALLAETGERIYFTYMMSDILGLL